DIIKKVPETIGNELNNFNPTITPILDLSSVNAGARSISSLFPTDRISADVSITQARVLSSAEEDRMNEISLTDTIMKPAEIRFEQTINAPKALSTNDIYRQTKSQI